MTQPVVGAQLFTLRDFCKTPQDLAATLKKVRQIGYTAVQLSGIGPMPAQAVADAVAAAGLKSPATHVGWGRFKDDLDGLIADHKLWGAPHSAVGSLPKEYFSAEGLELFARELPPIAERLAAEGMTFSFHNHSNELAHIDGKCWLTKLYETIAPEHLKVEIDTYWITAGGGDPAAWVARYPGRQPLLHFKDMIVEFDRTQKFAPVGDGNLNWPAIIDAARKADVEWIFVEQDNAYGADPFECLARSYNNLVKLGLK